MFLIKKQFQFLAFFILISGAAIAQKETAEAHKARWKEPAGIENVKNPFAGVAAASDSGKITYMKICSVCHGTSGKGDGVAAAGLTIKPADHTGSLVQGATDGQLFWEITNGHAPMPTYKSILTDKQRWQLICFIRTLKGKSK